MKDQSKAATQSATRQDPKSLGSEGLQDTNPTGGRSIPNDSEGARKAGIKQRRAQRIRPLKTFCIALYEMSVRRSKLDEHLDDVEAEANIQSLFLVLEAWNREAQSTLLSFSSSALLARLDNIHFDYDQSTLTESVFVKPTTAIRQFQLIVLELWAQIDADREDKKFLRMEDILALDDLFGGRHPLIWRDRKLRERAIQKADGTAEASPDPYPERPDDKSKATSLKKKVDSLLSNKPESNVDFCDKLLELLEEREDGFAFPSAASWFGPSMRLVCALAQLAENVIQILIEKEKEVEEIEPGLASRRIKVQDKLDILAKAGRSFDVDEDRYYRVLVRRAQATMTAWFLELPPLSQSARENRNQPKSMQFVVDEGDDADNEEESGNKEEDAEKDQENEVVQGAEAQTQTAATTPESNFEFDVELT